MGTISECSGSIFPQDDDMHEMPKKGTKRDIPGWEKVEEQGQEIVEREQHGESQEESPDQNEDDRDEKSKLRTVPAHSSRHYT